MASLGTFLLLFAFVTCSYAGVISVVGARRQSRRLIESGIGAFYLICAIMIAASAVMVNVFLLSIFGSLAVYVNRERHRELIPYVVATISTVQMFFLYLMVVHKNPFTTYLTSAPTEGEGLNPLLQNFYMASHP